MARQFGVTSKFSLERLSAQEADCFTTPGQNTNNEAKQFLGIEADLLTPEGFDDSWVPPREVFNTKRETSRNKIMEVAAGLMGMEFPKNTILILNSGRFELRNKGYELFIDALGLLNSQSKLSQPIIAVVAIPGGPTAPKKDLINRINQKDFSQIRQEEYCTHTILEPENDQILKRIKARGLMNRPEDKVKVIYIPTYLTGTDGIFDLNYYDLLIGFDGTVFPSYYEPWGYSSLESLSYHIPTITTSLTGSTWSIYSG